MSEPCAPDPDAIYWDPGRFGELHVRSGKEAHGWKPNERTVPLINGADGWCCRLVSGQAPRVSYLGLVTVVVGDYDEAVAFYVDRLGFELVEDTRIDEEKRWVVVAPPGARESAVLLARAAGEGQQARIGDQTGGRVGWFLNTEAFDRDYERMRQVGVVFEEAPRHEPYGTVAVFRDLYGNRWDLIQPHRVDATDEPDGTTRQADDHSSIKPR